VIKTAWTSSQTRDGHAASYSQTYFLTACPDPHLKLVKTQSRTAGGTYADTDLDVHAGDGIFYKLVVSNTGNTSLSVTTTDPPSGTTGCDGPLQTAASGGVNVAMPDTIAAGASKTYFCQHVATAADGAAFTNHACTAGKDPNGTAAPPKAGDSLCDEVTVKIWDPGLTVDKTAAQTAVHSGEAIDYTIVVKNTGDIALTVTATDVGCDLGTVAPFNLAVGGSKTLHCSHIAPSVGTSYLNEACAHGVDFVNGTADACDTTITEIPHPAIHIEKTGPATAEAGGLIAYDMVVTNPGDEPFAANTVVLADQMCGTTPTLVAKGHQADAAPDATPASLDPGDAWGYRCTVQTAVGDAGPVHNVAVVCAMDRLAASVCDDDDADTTLTQPEQLLLPERITPGSARLFGPTGCASRAFNARIRGAKIATVVFTLDGKRVKRLVKPNSGKNYQFRVNPSQLRIGVHRLVANVTFERGSGTRARTLRLSFQRCARKLALPRFTG
jgi:hypothetical protein